MQRAPDLEKAGFALELSSARPGSAPGQWRDGYLYSRLRTDPSRTSQPGGRRVDVPAGTFCCAAIGAGVRPGRNRTGNFASHPPAVHAMWRARHR